MAHKNTFRWGILVFHCHSHCGGYWNFFGYKGTTQPFIPSPPNCEYILLFSSSLFLYQLLPWLLRCLTFYFSYASCYWSCAGSLWFWVYCFGFQLPFLTLDPFLCSICLWWTWWVSFFYHWTWWVSELRYKYF